MFYTIANLGVEKIRGVFPKPRGVLFTHTYPPHAASDIEGPQMSEKEAQPSTDHTRNAGVGLVPPSALTRLFWECAAH